MNWRVEVLKNHFNPSEVVAMQGTAASVAASSSSTLPGYCLTEGEILSELYPNGCLKITLNRPKALNSLSIGMLKTMTSLLSNARPDPNVKYVVITSIASCKAFCAGGDIKSLTAPNSEVAMKQFFETEFNLNRIIYRFSKPIIALLRGITFGGGVGLSAFCSHRVANLQQFEFAMPEANIGLYNDVGTSYCLSHFPPSYQIGVYLALTGERIRAYDALYCNLVSHVVTTTADFDVLEKELTTSTEIVSPSVTAFEYAKVNRAIDKFLDPFRPDLDQVAEYSVIDRQRQEIEQIFDAPTMNELVARLNACEDSEFAKKILVNLRAKCPMSLAVCLEAVRRGAETQSLETVLRVDYRLAQRMVQRPDFKEGVRAVLIDKDNKPKWNPSTIEQVSQHQVLAMFEEALDKEIVFSNV